LVPPPALDERKIKNSVQFSILFSIMTGSSVHVNDFLHTKPCRIMLAEAIFLLRSKFPKFVSSQENSSSLPE
jgi:hypothetical protein